MKILKAILARVRIRRDGEIPFKLGMDVDVKMAREEKP